MADLTLYKSQIPERWYAKILCGTANPFTLARELYTAEAALAEAQKGREHERKVKEQHLERMGEYQDEVTRLQEINHELVNTHNTHVIMGARQNDEIKRLDAQVTQQAATIGQLRVILKKAADNLHTGYPTDAEELIDAALASIPKDK